MSIENELREIEGVSGVEGNIGAKTVTVEWAAPATYDTIIKALKEINYPAAE